MELKEAPGGPKASQGSDLTLQGMSGNPFLGFQRDVHEGLKVMETEGSSITPFYRT